MKRKTVELDLFTSLDTCDDVEKISWNEINTDTVLSNDVSSLVFTIPKASGRKMIDLFRTQFCLDVSFTKSDSSDNKLFAPINNTLHSMFENCIIKLNDSTIYDSNKNYHYTAYCLDLLDRSQEQKDGLLTSQLWFKDRAGFFDSCKSTANTGFGRRSAIALGGTISMIGRLHSELFNQQRYMINDVKLTVELTLAKDTFYLMADHEGTGKYKTKISEAKLYVPYVILSEKASDEIYRSLQSKPCIYPIQRVHTKSITIGTQSTDFELDISKGRLPKRVLISIVTDKAKKGEYKKNPYKYLGKDGEIFDIDKLELNVDHMPYAKRALKPDFKGNDYAKSFMNLYESLNFIQDGTNAPNIPFKEFQKGYCIFPFTLNPGCISEPGAFKREGEVKADISFKSTPTETLQAIITCVYDNEIRIDKNREVSKDW